MSDDLAGPGAWATAGAIVGAVGRAVIDAITGRSARAAATARDAGAAEEARSAAWDRLLARTEARIEHLEAALTTQSERASRCERDHAEARARIEHLEAQLQDVLATLAGRHDRTPTTEPDAA